MLVSGKGKSYSTILQVGMLRSPFGNNLAISTNNKNIRLNEKFATFIFR